MGNVLLCLDIHEEMVVAVALERSAKITRIIGCVQVDTLQYSFAEAIDQVRQELGVRPGRCRITLGAELFSFRNIDLPFTGKKKIEQVLSMELAEQIPVEIDTLLFDYVVTKNGLQGTEILAAMIERTFLAERLAVLQAAGMESEFIGVSGMYLPQILIDKGQRNFILLDNDRCWATLFIVREGRVVTIRSLAGRVENDVQCTIDERLDLFVRQTLLGCHFPQLQDTGNILYHTGPTPRLSAMSGLVVKKYGANFTLGLSIDPHSESKCRSECLDRVMACGLGPDKHPGVLNFCKEEFRRKKTFHYYRRRFVLLGAPILLSCVLIGLYFNQEYRMMKAQQESLRLQIAEVFTATIPTTSRIVHPVQQLQVLVNEVKSTYRPGGISSLRYSVIDLLTEISARIPVVYSVKVVRLVADAETLLLKAVTGDFNTVDNVQKELKKSPYFKEVVISSANQGPHGDAVSFELKLVLAGK
ncbi:MAG: PilN domain-containing protein [Proteobacteria bacterium]|nr:PilN domain-containing protein [Pseudomonadota bacterium]